MLPSPDSVADASLRDELPPGQSLLWSGRPGGGLLTASDVKGVLGGAVSLGVFAFAVFGLLQSGIFGIELGSLSFGSVAGWLFSPYGVVAAIIVLYSVFWRYLVDAARRRRTFYGVTNDQVIISTGLFGRNTRSVDLRSVSDLRLDEKPDGTGSITFGAPEEQPHSWWGHNSLRPLSPQFERIPQARKVYETVRDAQRRASER